MICYEENPVPRAYGKPFDFAGADPHKFYLEHYKNRLFLVFMETNTLATPDERAQARRELVICDRKLAYWSRHPEFKISNIATQIAEVQKEWKS